MRQVWDWVELSAPQPLERILIPRLYELKDLVRPLVKPYLDISELQGQGKGSPLKVTYVGLDYGKWHLKSVMFTERPEEIAKDPVSVWRPDEVANAPDSDIVIVAANQRLVRNLPRQNAIILPLYVDHILDIRGEWEDVKKRLCKTKSIRTVFHGLEKHGYTHEISHNVKDFEMHYETMYLPTMEKRHGDAAIVVPKKEARLLFRHGCLFLVKRDGKIVAGSLCQSRGEKVKFIYLGIANGDEQLWKEGVIDVMNVLRIRWAHQAGYKTIDLLGCPPYLRLGIFQYKRKWGTTISTPPNSHEQIWFRFQRDTPAVRQFLKDNPCVIIDENGDLQGLVVVDDTDKSNSDTKAQIHKEYYTPGMKGILICSADDLLRGTRFGSGSAKIHSVQGQQY